MKSNIQTSEFKSKTFPPAYNPSKTPTFASPDYPVPSNLCNVPIMLNSRCSQLLNASSNSRNPDFIQGDKPPNMILCEILSWNFCLNYFKGSMNFNNKIEDSKETFPAGSWASSRFQSGEAVIFSPSDVVIYPWMFCDPVAKSKTFQRYF